MVVKTSTSSRIQVRANSTKHPLRLCSPLQTLWILSDKGVSKRCLLPLYKRKSIVKMAEIIWADLCNPTKFFHERIKCFFSSATVWRQKESWKLNPTQERYQAAKYSEDRAEGAGAYQAWKNVLRSNKAYWQELYCCGEEVIKKEKEAW